MQLPTVKAVVDSKEGKPGRALSPAKMSNCVMNKCFLWMKGKNDKGENENSTWLSQSGSGANSSHGGRLAMLNNKYPLLARGVLVANHGGEGDPGEKAAILVACCLLVNDLGDEIIAKEKLLVGSDMYRRVKGLTLAQLTGIDPETLSGMVIYFCVFICLLRFATSFLNKFSKRSMS